MTLPPLPDTNWTPDATLFHSAKQMLAYAQAAVLAERERMSSLMDLKASDLRLLAGEMTAGELRAVTEILDWLKVKVQSGASDIRARGQG